VASLHDDFKDNLNAESMQIVSAMVEPCLGEATSGDRYQFERRGYFCVDSVDSRAGVPVFNRIVPLRDSWAKKEKQAAKQ